MRRTLPPVGRDRPASTVRYGYPVGNIDGEMYVRTYYSGADARFEIDGVPVDEICGISWQVAEPVQSHFGYASYTRLAVSRGARMVNGQIHLNFTDPTYLLHLLSRIREGKTPDAVRDTVVPALEAESSGGKKTSQVFGYVGDVLAGTLTPDSAARALTEYGRPDLSTQFDSTLLTGKPDPEMIRAFRQSLWGQGNDPKSSSVKNPYTPANPARGPRYGGRVGGFTLRVIYGEPESEAIYSASDLEGLDALFRRAPSFPSVDQQGRQLGAVVLFTGMEFMGEGTEVSESGDPVRCVYPFTATDLG